MSETNAVLIRSAGFAVTTAELLGSPHVRAGVIGLLQIELTRKIALAAAREAGITVATSEIQQAANRHRQKNGLSKAEDTHRWLERECLTAADFETILEDELMLTKFKNHLFDRHGNQHYEVNRARFARVQVRQIVVANEGVARELLSQLGDDGRAFAELAREHSLDAATRLIGGAMGVLPRLALPAAAAAAIFEAAPGDVVGPVLSDRGYHLFQIDAFSEPSLDAISTSIIREELFHQFLADRRAGIRVNLNGSQRSIPDPESK